MAAAVSANSIVKDILRSIRAEVNINIKKKQNDMVYNENLVQAIIKIIKGTVPANVRAPTIEEKQNIIAKLDAEILDEAIIKIIRNALANKNNVKTVLPENMRKSAEKALNTSNTVSKLILEVIRNSTTGALKKDTAEKVVKVAGAPPKNSRSILRIIIDALKRNETVEKAKKIEEEVPKANRPVETTNETSNLIYKVIMNVFKNKVQLKDKMANEGVGGYNLSKNFLESRKKNNQVNIAIPEYIFTTGNKGTGYYKNTGKLLIPEGPALAPVTTPRNYSGKTLKELFNARAKFPNNADKINAIIRSKLNTTKRNMKYTSGSMFFRTVADILKVLPENYPGRSVFVDLVIDEIRRISRKTNLDYARTNLSGVRNRRIKDEVNRKARNLRERRPENQIERRRLRIIGEPPRRYTGEGDQEFRRRQAEYNQRKEEANRNEMVRRRAARATLMPPRLAPLVPEPPSQMGGGLLVAPPPLLPNQQQAITNAGGIQRAVNTIAAVPGGAPEVAKAAEALNETGGNVAVAVSVKGVSPQAVKAVQNLGGVKNTVNVLEGLNTLSQTPTTRRRKAKGRRTKKTPVRLTELNRVIDAVKKQKLISLMAHNITRTNNIHPNDEKRKKYYKKVVKSYILKKPFANVVKRAARKNM